MSPSAGDQNRMGTPQDAQQFAQNMGYPGAFNPVQFSQNMPNAPQMGMHPQMQMAQAQLQAQGMTPAQRQYQINMQAQARQLQAQQARAMNGMNMNTPQGNPRQPGPVPQKPNSPEELLRQLQSFMAARGRTVDQAPVICSKPVPLIRFYGLVLKCGGSTKVTQANQWAFIAQNLGFPPPHIQQAAQELQGYWFSNLAPFESAWHAANQQKNQMRMAAQANVANQLSPTRTNFAGEGPGSMGHQRSQSDMMALKMNAQMLNNAQQQTNNFSGPQQIKDSQEPTGTSQHRQTPSRQFEGHQMNGMSASTSIATPGKTRPGSSDQSFGLMAEPSMPIKRPIEDPFIPETIPPSNLHGPINTDEMFVLGQNLIDIKPVNPHVRELGLVDIHALTMAVRSGMHAETRLALDTLITISIEPSVQLSLVQCEDLMETLVDCAQDQVDFLAEHATEVSDDMFLSSYEELVKACKIDAQQLQDIPEFGSIAYDLDRAADRLVCITTLIRNLSFYEANFSVLGLPEVIKFLTCVIRHLGTKENLLRSNRNTLDLMKDVIIYLSNSSHSIQLPGKEEALCFLHFLLAFAPNPPPISTSSDKVTFTMYSPSVHKYLPSAVDSLAKLLARDEPNRTYFKSIFAADAHSTPAYELITRAFGLAIAPLPASPMTSNRAHSKAIIEARKPFLLQGMLAAEILAGLTPNADHSLARSWLESEDGFAAYLLKLLAIVSSEKPSQPAPPRHPQQQGRTPPEQDPNAYGAITSRAMAILKTLVQRSRTTNAEGVVDVPVGVLPKKEYLLGAMLDKDIDPHTLRQLCVYAGLED